MPPYPVANIEIATATGYASTCKTTRSRPDAIHEGSATRYLAEIRQVICQTTTTYLGRGLIRWLHRLPPLPVRPAASPAPPHSGPGPAWSSQATHIAARRLPRLSLR